MHAPRPVTVVNIVSPSYTGTTWLGLLLGSHARAFALGAPDRVWRIARGDDGDEGGDACRVHGAECPFWPDFLAGYDRGDNLYTQLAAASGRDVVIINNPSPEHARAELRHPDLVVHQLRVVRDGRALACSFARHHDVDFFDAVQRYVRGVYRDFPFDPGDAGGLSMRYEDLVADQPGHLERIGRELGLAYDEAATRFWEFEHHVTAGNAGAIALLKSFQGVDENAFRNRPFYREQFERMREQGGAFLDERWKDELGPRERFVFDHFCGSANAGWGYAEDAFTTAERDRFARELAVELRPARSRFAEGARAAVRRLRQLAVSTAERLPRSRRRLAAIAIVAWLASLVLTWLLAAWITR